MSFIEKGITDLLSSLSTGEMVSLLFILGGAAYYGLKWYSHVKNFVKETAQEEIKREGERTDSDKIKEHLITLKDAIDKLIQNTENACASFDSIHELDRNVGQQIQMISDRVTDFKTILDSKLIALNDQMVDMHKELDEKLSNADSVHKELINGLTILKMTIERLESSIKDMSPENKMLHQETLRQVQAVSKDLATLQGTIIGNMSGSRTTLR